MVSVIAVFCCVVLCVFVSGTLVCAVKPLCEALERMQAAERHAATQSSSLEALKS